MTKKTLNSDHNLFNNQHSTKSKKRLGRALLKNISEMGKTVKSGNLTLFSGVPEIMTNAALEMQSKESAQSNESNNFHRFV